MARVKRPPCGSTFRGFAASKSAMLKTALTLALVALPVVRLDGTRIEPPQIDTTVMRSMQQIGIPGIGIALFNHGTVVYSRAYGQRDLAGHKPLTPDSVMTAASLTKPVFAVLVLQLVEQRVL